MTQVIAKLSNGITALAYNDELEQMEYGTFVLIKTSEDICVLKLTKEKKRHLLADEAIDFIKEVYPNFKGKWEVYDGFVEKATFDEYDIVFDIENQSYGYTDNVEFKTFLRIQDGNNLDYKEVTEQEEIEATMVASLDEWDGNNWTCGGPFQQASVFRVNRYLLVKSSVLEGGIDEAIICNSLKELEQEMKKIDRNLDDFIGEIESCS